MLIFAGYAVSVLAIAAMFAIGAFVEGSGRRAILIFALLILYVTAIVPMTLAISRT